MTAHSPRRSTSHLLPLSSLGALLLVAICHTAPLAQAAPPPSGDIYSFPGQIESVDSASGTFRFRVQRRVYLLKITPETTYALDGKPRKIVLLQPGQTADVTMRVSPDGRGTVSSIYLKSAGSNAVQIGQSNPFGLPSAVVMSLFAATTPGGKTLSAPQLAPLVLYSTWPQEGILTLGQYHLKMGVFILAVRDDGTVSKVETLQSIGHRGMDGDVIRALKKWRFRPGSVNEVRVPAYYSRTR